MKLEKIYEPIAEGLFLVEKELRAQLISGYANQEHAGEITEYFFNVPGKRLRAALALLAFKIVNRGTEYGSGKVIKLAAAMELIQAASLIHDDIIDDSPERRGQPSLNKRFGNRLAVLAGDMLSARAFSLLAANNDAEMLRIISRCMEKMCRGEINEIKSAINCFDDYLEIISEKTASFMAVCCHCGALLAHKEAEEKTATEGDSGEVLCLKEYGLNFGITYQLMDDFTDNDPALRFEVDLCKKAQDYADLAFGSIKLFKDSKYKESLTNLLRYVLEQKYAYAKSV